MSRYDTGCPADSVYLSLGSNLGDRQGHISRALFLIEETLCVKIISRSPIYETEPVGFLEQGPFLNCCACIEAALPPLELLGSLKDIERQLRRAKTVRFGPRTIDIDILLYGGLVMDTDRLTIPHPRMMERAFVLVPLLDIYPKGGPYAKELYSAAKKVGSSGVRLFSKHISKYSPGSEGDGAPLLD